MIRKIQIYKDWFILKCDRYDITSEYSIEICPVWEVHDGTNHLAQFDTVQEAIEFCEKLDEFNEELS